ncbi:MAG: sensor histidine kinase, partial [Leptolyngbyaceae cyanobacterium bins.59]|nr:sensor histidine kinase [Leptolyngbyaceae cyanobacterium bins.59]
MFNQSRRRLTYWFALCMGSILVLFTGVVYYREVEDQMIAFDQALYRKSRVMAAKVHYRVYAGQWLIDLAEVPLLGSNAPAVDSELVYARWYSADGRLLHFVGKPLAQPLPVNAGFQTVQVGSENTPLPPDQWLRQVTLPVQQGNLLVGYLQIATPLAPMQAHLGQRRLFLSLGVPVTLGVIGMAGWFLGGLA